jgi:hypothetical protein
MQRHSKNRTEDKERRQAKQRNTTQKTKKDEGHGPQIAEVVINPSTIRSRPRRLHLIINMHDTNKDLSYVLLNDVTP